ncbi:hypothetical protein L2E82_14260 [Cichorium intybus]|uniref:Uncharacterized protein n=1 Tax=Cichorium intybus TaxID=13427 RepID=A0ACB9EZG5_CICIN|nr:hypothetical protein L2E82_14260 [Cichorium intybus]
MHRFDLRITSSLTYVLLQATTTPPPRISTSLDAKTLDCTLLHLSVSSRNPSHIPPLSISRSHGLLKIIIHETRKRRGYAKAANAVQLTIDSIWTCLIIGDECEHPKPTPDPYLKAIEVLNVSKAHTFMCKVKSTIAFWIFNLVGFTCSAKVEAVTWE